MKKDDIIKKVESKFGKDKFEFSLLSETRNYKGGDVLDLICKKHGEFSITLGTILKKITLSGVLVVKKIKRLLKRNNISYIPQKTFDWLIYNKHLFLDFYIPENKLSNRVSRVSALDIL